MAYAPTSEDAMADYGRINIHLDSYPVGNTTTTLVPSQWVFPYLPVAPCRRSHICRNSSARRLRNHICRDQDQL